MSYKVTDTTIVDQSRNISNIGIATFAGPLLVGSGSSTGTPLQVFQVTGSNGAYIGGNLGIGSTNPSSKLSISGDAFVSGIVTGSVLVASKDPGTGIATDFTNSVFGNGWRLSAPASTTYYRLATLPVGSSGNTFDHLSISGVLGAWTSTNQTPFQIYFSNRASFNFEYISYGTVRSDVRILGISTNSTVEIWAQHQASQFTKLVYNISDSLQAIVIKNPTSTTTAPVGTTVFDSSTATPRFIINDSDNVGIGTTNPTTRLQINGVLGFGTSNIRIGDSTTGSSITSGTNNFFAGINAGFANTTGNSNNFVGLNAGCSNTTGSNNNFFGFCAGRNNTTGSYNNFFGAYAGRFNTTGGNNNFFGNNAGRYNTTGTYNNFFGPGAGFANTTGSSNNFFGCSAGFSNTTGINNNFFGRGAGLTNTTGSFNNFFGCYAGRNNTTGINNNFFGPNAGLANTTGGNNTFFGSSAGRCNTTGSFNNFLGQNAGRYNTTGINNNFFGFYSGLCNAGASNNNFFGSYSGCLNTGNFNNFFGPGVGRSNTSGNNNTFFGNYAGRYNTTGSCNIFLGPSAGSANITGSQNIVIGFNRNTPIVSGSNQLVIGSGSTTWINGNSSYNIGIGTTNPTSKLSVIGDALISGIITANSFRGDGSQLTGIVASGSGIVIRDDGSLVGTATSIDFGTNLTVSPVSSGVVTVTASGGGGSSQWITTSAGIHTLSNVGIGTTNPTALLTVRSKTVNDFVGLFSGTTNNDLVRITQDGTGNALRVDDQAGGTTPFIVDNSGKVGINTVTATSNLTVFGDSRITGITTSGYLDGNPITTLSGSILAHSYGMAMP